MALLNSMYGDGNAGFCKRVIKAGTGKRALLEGGGAPLLAGTKSRKGGARKSTIQCKACGQVRCLVDSNAQALVHLLSCRMFSDSAYHARIAIVCASERQIVLTMCALRLIEKMRKLRSL